ncbi:MAG: cytochrome-c peroxidase, partial [Bacteroidetes bacterium]
NFSDLPNYSDQYIPVYINKDNTPANNSITNQGATLGRVLFYDPNLSTNNIISCASCHQQEHAFSDTSGLSQGINGETGRHSMRLINSRFAIETNFFWDERASSLEQQTTMPIQDHVEMGFSGENGDLGFSDLVTKLESIEYYPELFNFAFGSAEISEIRIQNALAQFVRSIQSFDSKYDEGRLQVVNDITPFPNFSVLENQGKNLFIQPPVFDGSGTRINGGVGCAGCHQVPEFDIDPNSLNNGVIGSSDGGSDITITRAPSLRDLVKQNGESNGPFMHIGVSNDLITVINHYNQINTAGNSNLDPRLLPNGNPQNLNMTQQEKNAVIAFIRTLTGVNVYIDEKWSNPFVN